MSDESRARLLALIRSEGILRARGSLRILGRRGQPGRWLLYLYPLSMTKDGMGLLVEELLRLVEPFQATQLAANGFGAVPLMTAMAQASDGRYTGLVVRPEAKRYGALRRIDGPGDRTGKVVVVDDSISSGTSFRRASAALEDEGYDVEGTACLVDFPGRGGRQYAEARGYRVETSFDIWDDVGLREPAPLPCFVVHMPQVWSDQRVPDGLEPAVAARRVAEHFADTGEALRPPRTLASSDSDPGGAFVSLRRRTDDRRLARRGFWHFEPGDADPCRDVVIATVQTLRSLPRAPSRAELDDLKFCVTFFGPLEQVGPSELDFSRYGIVVRSRVAPRKMGGALPNTQYFTSTWEQYRHARSTNAGLMELEDHDLYRHELVKHVEPGESWPPYGEDERSTERWLDVPGLGDKLLRRAEEVIGALRSDAPIPTDAAITPDLLSHQVESVVVGLYGQGTEGCTVGRGASLDQALVTAVRGALADRRFRSDRRAPDETVSWSVSLLHSPERLGQATAREVARKFRRGRDALFVQQGDRRATYLDSVIVQHDWTKEDTTRALLKKAGIIDGPCTWTTYKTAAWVHTPEGNFELSGGHCRHGADRALAAEDVALLAEHLVRRQDIDGWPAYAIGARHGSYVRRGTATRCLHALRVLDLAGQWAGHGGWCAAARRGIDHALEGLGRGPGGTLAIRHHTGGAGAEACLLGAVASSGHPALGSSEIRSLAERVRATVLPDGCVLAPGMTRSRADADLLPGSTLVSLATYCAATGQDLGLDWHTIRSWYLRRARLVHPWGLMSWQAQVWDLVGKVTGDVSHYQTTLELCEWMVERQLSVDGSFLTDMGTAGPGFHTAFVAEGIAAGIHAASVLGDETRVKRFCDSWQAAMSFCDRLVFRRCDTYWTPEPTAVLGAIRATPYSSALRVDFTSHTLQALVNGLAWAPGARR